MKTKAMIITLMILLMFGPINIMNIKALEAVTVIVNGQRIDFPDAPAYIDTNGRMQVPSRFISEALGLRIDWNDETRAVTFSQTTNINPISVIFYADSAEYTLHTGIDSAPQVRTMDTKAVIEQGRVYIPVRYIAEAFNVAIEWDSVMQTVTLKLIKINLSDQDITNERLAEMVAAGEIPLDVTHLNLAANLISDVSPLSSFTNLTELDLWGNEIDDVSPLSNLTNLRVLNLWGNRFNDISPLSNLTNLTDFSLGDQPQFNGDLSTLSNFSNLTRLGLGGGQISDFTPLGSLSKLEHLQLWGVDQLKDLSIIGRLTNLTSLTVHGAQIKDFAPLSNLTKLAKLNLQSMPIRDVSSLYLDSLTNLTRLQLFHTQITDISALSELKNLKELFLSDNLISDISALSGLKDLTTLFLNNNQINEISALSGLTGSMQLVLDNNEISDWSPVAHITDVSGRP